MDLETLKTHLGSKLCSGERLRKPEGVPTGLEAFDSKLVWGGFPKGEMTLLLGELGTGATSFWIEAAAQALACGKWAAWIEGEASLCPTSFKQRGVDLSKLLVVKQDLSPARTAAKAWLRTTRELLSSSLFETIGSGASCASSLRESQMRKVLGSCRTNNAALVLISQSAPPPYLELFALIVRFEKHRIFIERASRRAPFELQRRISYATFSQHSGSRSSAVFAPCGESRLQNSNSLLAPQKRPPDFGDG